MDERAEYAKIADYDVIPNHEPPSTSRAITGVNILGKKFFMQPYKKPKRA